MYSKKLLLTCALAAFCSAATSASYAAIAIGGVVIAPTGSITTRHAGDGGAVIGEGNLVSVRGCNERTGDSNCTQAKASAGAVAAAICDIANKLNLEGGDAIHLATPHGNRDFVINDCCITTTGGGGGYTAKAGNINDGGNKCIWPKGTPANAHNAAR